MRFGKVVLVMFLLAMVAYPAAAQLNYTNFTNLPPPPLIEPNNPLYGIKVFLEHIIEDIASINPDWAMSVHISHLRERMAEAEYMAMMNDTAGMMVAMHGIYYQLDAIENLTPMVSQPMKWQAINATKDVEDIVTHIHVKHYMEKKEFDRMINRVKQVQRHLYNETKRMERRMEKYKCPCRRFNSSWEKRRLNFSPNF